MKSSNVDYKQVRTMTDIMCAAFELIAHNQGITPQELLELQAALEKKNGKYNNDYSDPLSKLAFDYHFCLEMLDVIDEEEWLSFPRRERLYNFATKNKDLTEIWPQFPNMLSPKVLLDDEERKISKIKRHRRHK
jgi:hypothetical protein